MPIEIVIKGDLIVEALNGKFNAICHGVNAHCRQRSGIAKGMVNTFGTDLFKYERTGAGDFNKMGNIDWSVFSVENKRATILEYRPEPEPIQIFSTEKLIVINCYTQFMWATAENTTPIDYTSLGLCFKKINHVFRDYHLGIPKIGAGLAGGNWSLIEGIINKVTPDVLITLVEYGQ